MSSVHAIVVQYTKMLRNLDNWLVKAKEFADAHKIDPTVLLETRLYPDMRPLMFQIQSACDGAKFFAARLSAKEPPKHPDTEKTFDEARARIQAVIDYCSGFKESDFAGVEDRKVPLGFMPGKGLRSADFMNELNMPNTYFHFTTAYAILRHSGVPLGKQDFLGSLNLIDL